MPISRNFSILFRGKEILTEKNIRAVGRRGYALDDTAPDMEILLDRMLGEPLHFQIFPNQAAGPLVLEAEMLRFPYCINGREGHAKFSIRLVPISGRIKEIQTYSGRATPSFCKIFLCTCDTLLIYFEPPRIPLGAIDIPMLYNKNVKVKTRIGS